MLSRRRLSSSSTLATLRRFLMMVHPDLIQKERIEERRVNATNVGLLQAYVREHQYQGSAWLLFHRKERAGTVRVVVGRGVDACVASMAVALGEAPPPDAAAPPPSRPERVVEWAGRWRQHGPRASTRPRGAPQTLTSLVPDDDVVSCRRAMSHAAAKARRAVAKHRLLRFESRCGWSSRHLVQVVTGLERVLEDNDFENLWSIVLSSSTEARADAVEGLVLVSPSMQVTDWRRALDDAVRLMDVRRDHARRYAEAVSNAERNIERALGRPVELKRGESLDRACFEEWCVGIPPVVASCVDESRPTLRIRLELDAHRGGFDDTSGSLALGFREKNFDRLIESADQVADDTVRKSLDDRALATRLAASCVEKFQLASLDLVLAQVPEVIRVTKQRGSSTALQKEDTFVLSGAHRQRGASLPDVLTALSTLHRHDNLPLLLRNSPVAIVARGGGGGGGGVGVAHDHAGVLVLPVDSI